MRAELANIGFNNLSSVLSWWDLAGVDVVVEDTPRDWLARPAPAPAAAPVVTTNLQPETAPAPETLPDTLEALREWLIKPETLPELGPRRCPAQGVIGSTLMLLSDMPDQDDLQAERLFAGAAGQLLDAMLKAIGQSRDDAYIASLAPGRPATGMISGPIEGQLRGIARQHVRLSAPKTLLLMGDPAVKAMTGMNLAQARGKIHQIDLGEQTMPAIATFHPRFLLQQPACKADAWADLRRLHGLLAA